MEIVVVPICMVVLIMFWLGTSCLLAYIRRKPMSPKEKREMIVQEIMQCMDYETALELKRKIKVSFDRMNVLEEAAIRIAGMDEEFRGTFHLTHEMAENISEMVFHGLELEKFNPWAPCIDIYCGKTSKCGLIVTVENDWNRKDGLIKLAIADAAGSQAIIQFFDPKSMNRCFVKKEKANDQYCGDQQS